MYKNNYVQVLIKRITETNYLPEYRLNYNRRDDKMVVYAKSRKGGLQELKNMLGV